MAVHPPPPTPAIRFRIVHLMYVMALIGASIALMGVGGIAIGATIIGIWAAILLARSNVFVDVVAILFLMVVVGVGAWFGMMVPAAREAARRMSCCGHYKQVVLALHNYHDSYGTLPPAVLRDEQGVAIHSWRTLVLPYIEQSPRYDAYDFDQPWNSPDNAELHTWQYDWRCPSMKDEIPPENIAFAAVVGEKAAFSEVGTRRFDDITRHSFANTIMLIEVNAPGIPYFQPKDLTYEEAITLLTSEEANWNAPHGGDGFYQEGRTRTVAMLDSSIHPLSNVLTREEAIALLSIDPADKELLRGRDIRDLGVRQKRYHIGNCVRFGTFVLLVVFPIPWAIRRWR